MDGYKIKRIRGDKMETGTIMLVIGIVGILICMIILVLLPGLFKKQRKKLLEEIVKEF